MKKQKIILLIVLIAIFVLSRLIFLFFTPYSYYNEEVKTGSIGHDILFGNGLKLPFWGYMDSPHAGGSIFSGLIAIPFYYIFGDKYLALKIAALFFSVLTLLIWFKLIEIDDPGNKKFFIPFLITFVFATPHYVQKSVILIGNTVELMFFNALTVLYLWKIKNKISSMPIEYFYLGIICGFSFWVQFLSIYLFATIMISLFVIGGFKKRTIQQAFWLISGFVLGTLPLWIYNLLYKWATFTADRRGFNFIFSPDKLGHLLFIDIPASFHFLDIGFIKSQWLGLTCYGLFLWAIVIHLGNRLLNKDRKHKSFWNNEEKEMSLEIFLILFLSVFISATALTTVPVGNNNSLGWNSMDTQAEYYIISLQPILFVLLVLLNKYRIKHIAILNILAGLIFFTGYLNLFTTPYYNESLFKPMHATAANAYECGFNFKLNKNLFFNFFDKLPLELRSSYLDGAAGRNELHEEKLLTN